MKDNRRDFIKKTVSLTALSFGGIGSVIAGRDENAANLSNIQQPREQKKSTIRIAIQSATEPNPENIAFYKQMGISDVVLWTNESRASAEYYDSRKKFFAEHGIDVYGFGNAPVHNEEKIVLNLPGRDEKIEQYKKHLRDLVFFLCCLSFAIPEAIGQTKPAGKPNVIIILADDMGYGDITSNNPSARTKTPNIDRMAQKSIVFTDAHSGGAVCIPSRYGLITGRYYFRLPQRQDFLGYLPPLIEQGRETIGSLMQKAGYTTAAVGKWHLGLNWQLKDNSKPQIPVQSDKTVTNTDFSKDVSGGPNSLGFNFSYILPASLDMPPYVFVKNGRVIDPNVMLTADAYSKTQPSTDFVWDRKHTSENDVYWERGVWWRNGEMSKSFKMENSLDTIVDQGLSFIEDHTRTNPQKPFMLYLALTGPHTPWLANKQFKGKSNMGAYGDFVGQIDDYVAQVNSKLKKLDIDDNTIVIFTSDNGAPWSEEDIQVYSHRSNYPKRGQKGDIYEGGHHIPLIIQWPKEIKEKFEYTQTVSLVDFMATFSELTGQPIKEKNGEDSFSFYDVIKNGSRAPIRDQMIYISSRNLHAIKKDEWKYIDGLGSGGFTEPGRLKPVSKGPLGQLYNLKSDPLEQNNLYLDYPSKVNELKALLDKLKTQGYSKEANR